MRAAALSISAAIVFAGFVSAQSPQPIVVQAATPGAAPLRAPAAPESSTSLPAALKMLQEMKEANDETLRKQAAMLEQLDALEKTAEQIKIFSRRG